MLKRVVNDTPVPAYCVPTALAAITGKPISKVRDAIRTARHNDWPNQYKSKPRSCVGGVYTSVTLRALKLLGYQFSRHEDWKPGITLARFLRERKPEVVNAVLLISVSKSKPHMVAVKGRKFLDSFTFKREGGAVWISKAPHRRSRVNRVFIVTKAGPPVGKIKSWDDRKKPKRRKRQPSFDKTGLIRLPKVFLEDHIKRDLPAPDIVHTTRTHHWVRGDQAEELSELLSDAEYHQHGHGYGVDARAISARHTAKALRKEGVT